MYSFPDLEPVCSSMSISNCCFLTCIQIFQEAGQVVWYSYLLKNFPRFVVIHTVKGFGIGNKAEVDVFLELSCFFDDPADVGSLISGSSVFPKSTLNIWKFTVHVLLKPGLENFEFWAYQKLSEPINSLVNRFSGWTRVTWKMLAVWEKLSRGLVKTHPPITSRNHFQKLLFWSISPCHHLFSSSCSELSASAKCQQCPIAFIHKGEESSVILEIPLNVYDFGFGDSLYQIWHSLKNWGNFILQSFKVMMENLVLFGLFLVLLWGSSLSKHLIVKPSEKIGMMTNPYTIWSLGSKDKHSSTMICVF